jgi:dihydroxyacetone kinase
MEDMLAGFLDAHSDRVTGVPGGVVRAAQTAPGKVAVVVGGGSGHYPAFCGVVGPGFADGAVVGNIFTSPSAEDAYSVGRAASGGGGVVITSGNYAGDVMNFTQAQDRLMAEGIEARVVFVTDDVASAPVSEVAKRRGIAGDFVVFKVMGAAAEEGCSLDEVVRIGIRANDRTRTLGVAFAGCTMPGADHPLFTVPVGMMGVGLGIHGEPGVSEDAIQPAADLARRLVDGAIAELELGDEPRVGAILNGLGATKYEELFVVWKTVSALLRERGVTVVDPEVGELVTSLDMAGCSLTLVALDDELERLWRAPADTPAYRKAAGSAPGWAAGERRHESVDDDFTDHAHAVATAASVACAARAFRALAQMQTALVEVEDELGRIDAIAGDGDHGRGMVKGIAAAVGAARPCADDGSGVATLLRSAGRAWQAKAGGTSGALWGAALVAVGDRLGDDPEEISDRDVVDALRSGQDAIQRLGKCELGDKTMLDALGPFVMALDGEVSAGRPLSLAWAVAAVVAERAAKDTAPMTPRVGRARPLAERSIGTPDAGATSLALCLAVAGRAFTAGVTDGA